MFVTRRFSSVQLLSHVWIFATPWIAARQASLSITNSRSSPRLTSIESLMLSSHLILCRPLLLLSPIPPSIRLVRPIRKHSYGESQASVQKNEQQQKKKKQPKNPKRPQNPLLWPAGYMGPLHEHWGGWKKRLISIDHVLFTWLKKKKRMDKEWMQGTANFRSRFPTSS